MRLASLSLATGLTLLVPEVAAAEVCSAYDAPSLKSCVASAKEFDEVELSPGEYLLLSPLVIDKGITVRARTAGTAVLTYKGTLDASQVFIRKETYLLDDTYLVEVTNPRTPVTLEGLVFEPPAGRSVVIGRALHVTGGEAIVEDCVLKAYDLDGDKVPDPVAVNNAEAVADPTGGIFALVEKTGVLTLEDSTITGINAPNLYGSAIYVIGAESRVNLQGSTALTGLVSGYGAIVVEAGAVAETLTDDAGVGPTFADNTAQSGGVFVAYAGSRVVLYAGSFIDNAASRESADANSTGGHVAAFDGAEVQVYGGLFAGGEATLGGSIGAIDAKVSVHGGSFTEADARYGGHVAVLDLQPDRYDSGFVMTGGEIRGGVAELSQAEQIENEAQPDGTVLYIPLGGGVFAYGADVTVTGGLFDGNSATELYGAGGALFAEQSLVDLDNPARFIGNSAARGGAVYAADATVDADRVDFIDNGGDDGLAGGAIQVDWADLRATGAVFSGNRAASGGAVTCFGELDCELVGVTFDDNHATYGGAVYLHASWADLDDTVFTDNTASALGGHLYATAGAIDETTSIYGTIDIAGGRFERGRAGHGGALEIIDVDATATGVQFTGNTATGLESSPGFGGAWTQKGGVLKIVGSTFDGNAGGWGGALYTLDVQSTTVEDSFFRANNAQYGGSVALDGTGGAELFRNQFRASEGEFGAAVLVVGPGSSSGGVVSFANNLVDGEGRSTNGAVGITGKSALVHHNDLVRYTGALVAIDDASVDFHHNLVGYSPQPILALFGTDAEVTHDFNAWWRASDVTSSPIQSGGSEVPLGRNAVLDNPRLRGALDGGLPPPPSPLQAYHPRPSSPLLLAGYPTDRTGAHIGIFGGAQQFTEDWDADADDDGAKRIFDCDDDDDRIGDRLRQFVDNDGDDVGDALWPGDDCVLLPGNALFGGDCDDADKDVWEDCVVEPELVAFYGSTCSTTSSSSLGGFGLVFLGLIALRRRRLHGRC